MQIVRFRVAGTTRYGVVEGPVVVEYAGTPWSLFRRGRRRFPLRQVVLLAPAMPSKIVGVGPDFVATLALLVQFLFTTLLIIAFGILFRIFAKYIPRIPAPDQEIEALLLADMRRAVMHEDTITAAQLDLSHVGDVYTGRKRLGPYVSVTHYRGLTLGFAAYAEKRFGQLGDALLYSVGRLTARSAMGDILREYVDREQAMRRIFDEIRANGIAIPEVVDRTEDRVTVRLYENVTAAGVPPEGRPICHYQSGMLSGIFEILTGRSVLAHEVHCWALGDRFCEFQLDLGADGAGPAPKAAPAAA